ncbi:hypothetical protein AMAG_16417 [Allomyces macrogynus ATCC 38327]|uniref:PX domain-containing protein n=1 Tax=Allomyces macrogynus (strain ATCC 38327) TaxID=578462 RepID=A0A0L0TD98_ALLM3|nr:hypothetical protein AMAG_16417 [Allomyces macrogynus ATCC 38327]|eukprot:KNE72656.1 hypothetical protein AMAG_16417 [Allomyces macrogynus ATCC 38327]
MADFTPIHDPLVDAANDNAVRRAAIANAPALQPLAGSATAVAVPPPVDQGAVQPASTSSSPTPPPVVSPLLRLYETPFDMDVTVLATRWAGADLLVRFAGKTSLPTIHGGTFQNERPHRDFERLSAYLRQTYSTSLQAPLPPIPSPPARALDRTWLAMMEEYLRRIARHPVFAHDAGLVAFMSSPAAFEPPVASSSRDLPSSTSPLSDPLDTTRAASPGGWGAKLRALVTSGPKDVDADFEARKDKVAELDFCMRALQRAADNLAAANRSMAAAYADVAVKATALGAAEASPPLAGAWLKLGQRLHGAADTYADHATVEGMVAADATGVALRWCAQTQDALDQRLRHLELYDDACRATERHKRKMEKQQGARALAEPKVSESLAKFDACRGAEAAARARFRTASDLLTRDWPVADANRIADLDAAMVRAWARAHYEAEKRVAGEVWAGLRASLP